MKIIVSQIYISPGINFPFSHLFQRWISKELTADVQPSADFARLYGDDFSLIFNMSAKAGILEPEIKGPTVFKRTKDVEYTIFLPYDTINNSDDRIAGALRYLFAGILSVLESLRIDAARVSKHVESMIEHVCSDASMIKQGRK